MRTARDRGAERGSAYLLLMVLVGTFAGLMTVALGALVPPQAEHRGAAELRLAALRTAAAADFVRNGSFAGSLDTLAARLGTARDGSWRLDPYGSVVDFRWRVRGRPQVLLVECRGLDGRLGNADDLSFSLSEQTLGRDRSRNHLRLLRADLVAWQANAGTSPMTPTDLATLRASSRAYAIAQRDSIWADTAGRAALAVTMSSSLATIRSLRSSYGIAFPTRLTGTSGLMRALGRPDSDARDGWNRTLLWNEAIGVVSRGADNRRDTTDDF